MNPTLHIPIVRVVRLAPEQAEIAFDAAVLAGGVELDLAPVTVAGEPALRAYAGRVRSPWKWSTLPVELELSAWSATKTALTLRPGDEVRGSAWQRWFFRFGHAFMDRLVAAMELPAASDVAPPRDSYWPLSA
jgi:hypothetical protein